MNTLHLNSEQLLYSQMAKTFFAILIVLLIYAVINILSGRITRKSIRERFKIRLFYVMTFVFLVMMIQIWLKGFGTIFAVVGFALAGIIVASKESVMNFTGFLIIQWRELFTEEDYIQINSLHGRVKKIGVLYISLLEYLPGSENIPTGRTIYVPNNSIITGQVINYSQTSHFLAYQIQFTITPTSPIEPAISLIKNTIRQVLDEYYQAKQEYSKEYLLRKDKTYTNSIEWDPLVDIAFRHEKPFGIQLKAHYYCYALDHDKIERILYEKLIPGVQKLPDVHFAYTS
jgi:small-conductance mechanosensitive channel